MDNDTEAVGPRRHRQLTLTIYIYIRTHIHIYIPIVNKKTKMSNKADRKKTRTSVEVGKRLNVDVTRFKGETWFHVHLKSNRQKCISLLSEDIEDLVANVDKLKRASYKVCKADLQSSSSASTTTTATAAVNEALDNKVKSRELRYGQRKRKTNDREGDAEEEFFRPSSGRFGGSFKAGKRESETSDRESGDDQSNSEENLVHDWY